MREKILSNFIWKFAERSGAQAIQFVVQIILARILEPKLYGTLALVTVVLAIMNVFVDSGFGNALIQKKDADELDFSTVFFFNIFICTVLYFLLFLFAPWIADYYGIDELTALIRALGLTLVISGFKNVQQAYVSRTLQFKRFFHATLLGTICAAVLGIAMAYRGYGIWALVVQYLVKALLDTIILWVTVKWHPRRGFSLHRLKELFSYGWKLLASGLLDTVYSNVSQLIIGKVYTSMDLAFYNRGNQFPQTIIENINTSMNSVLFPVMSEEQEKKDCLRSMTKRAIKVSTYVIAPMMIGLVVIAPTVVSVILSEKWLSCVPYLRIFCLIYLFYPIHTVNLNAIKALGRSDYFLKLEIVKKILGITILIFTMRFGVMAMAYGLLASSIFGQVINTWPNKRLFGYQYFDQLRDISGEVIISLVMGISVFVTGIFCVRLSQIVMMMIQIMVGFLFYLLLSVVLKMESFEYILATLRKSM